MAQWADRHGTTGPYGLKTALGASGVANASTKSCVKQCETEADNAQKRWKSWLVGVNLKQREDYHASNRNVEPDGKGEPCNAPVRGKPAAERKKQSRQYQRQCDNGEKDVATQNGKINCTNRPRSRKVGITVQSVVHDIADEE